MTITDMIKELRERAEDLRFAAAAEAKAFNTPVNEERGKFEDDVANALERMQDALRNLLSIAREDLANLDFPKPERVKAVEDAEAALGGADHE